MLFVVTKYLSSLWHLKLPFILLFVLFQSLFGNCWEVGAVYFVTPFFSWFVARQGVSVHSVVDFLFFERLSKD